MRVLFVGDKPSKLNKDASKAFIGAKCEARLNDWIKALGVDAVLTNSHDEASLKTIKEWNGPIIALGKVAQSRLRKIKVSHFEMPHPSRLNRQLNNKDYIVSILDKIKNSLLKDDTLKIDTNTEHLLSDFVGMGYRAIIELTDVDMLTGYSKIVLPKEKQLLIYSISRNGLNYNIYYFRNTDNCISNVILGPKTKFKFVNSVELYKQFNVNALKLGPLMGSIFKGYMTIGSDPEIFVENTSGVIPAFNFLPSKKDVNGKNQVAYWDGFQAEFNTLASGCNEIHLDSVRYGLQDTLNAALKHDKNAKLSIKTLIEVSPEELAKASDEHVAFGCMPSFNAYGMSGMLGDGRTTVFRSAGGHLHFGVGKILEQHAIPIVKALDAIIGVACVSLFAKYDSPARRVMYGLAGEYRLPKHGLEYRTLSNAWLMHPIAANLVIDIARKAFLIGARNLMHLWNATEIEVIETINTCNVEKAREILKRNEKFFKEIIASCYGHKQAPDLIFNVFINGIESAIANPDNISKNWGLNNNEYNHRYVGSVRVNIETLNQNKKVA